MTAPVLIDDCFRPTDERLTHGDAVALLRSRTCCTRGHEPVALVDLPGRILAQDVRALRNIPLHTNAAVDGFGVSWSDDLAQSGGTFAIVGRAAAGHPFSRSIGPGEAVHILTGAVVPAGVDCIVMQEDVALVDGTAGARSVTIPAGVSRNANIRPAGEDVQQGGLMFPAGQVVRASDLAAIASTGASYLTCFTRLRIGVVSTGDEIVRADGQDLITGQVFDSNSPMLEAALKAAGHDVVPYGIWPDDAADIEARLAEAARTCDVVLTTGGASRGQEDHMAAAIDALGTRHMWQLAIKPGRPLMFGQIGQTVVVGLPGNPVAVFVCYLMYVFPLLRQLAGAGWFSPKVYPLPAAFDVKKRKAGRREFWRAKLVAMPDGDLAVEKFPNDGSGLISGLRTADGLIDIPEALPGVQRGDTVRFMPFSQFGIPERTLA
ncbi:MAG: gephyrin-like molybdotransferase Glp [Pseudomonadota bacterium]